MESIVTASSDTLSNIQLVVIDDGSTDGTKDVVEAYSDHLQIDYIGIGVNCGRAPAIHSGVESLQSEYTMIIDSDDYFVNSVLDSILDDLEEIADNPGAKPLVGYCYRLMDSNGELLGPRFFADRFTSNFASVSYGMGHDYDKKEVVLTEVLKSKMYPLIQGERRFPTSYIWDAISREYDVIFMARPVMVKVYESHGMTKNVFSLRNESPYSSYLAYRQKYELSQEMYMQAKYRIRFFLLMLRYGYVAGRGEEVLGIFPSYQRPFIKFAYLIFWSSERLDNMR